MIEALKRMWQFVVVTSEYMSDLVRTIVLLSILLALGVVTFIFALVLR